MAEETNNTQHEVKEVLTKEQMEKQLTEEIVILKLELEHATLITDIQEQSTKRSSLLIQEANIIASNQPAKVQSEGLKEPTKKEAPKKLKK